MKNKNPKTTYLDIPTREKTSRVLALVLIIFLVVLGYASVIFQRGIIELREAQSDNRVWNISQLEVDFQRFLINLQDIRLKLERNGRVSQESHASLTTDFDIFYSRINPFISTVALFDDGKAQTPHIDQIREIRDTMAYEFDRLPRSGLEPVMLDEISNLLAEYVKPIREITVASLQFVNRQSEINRIIILQKFWMFNISAIILIGITIGLLGLSIYLDRQQSHTITQFKKMAKLVQVAFENSVTAIFVCDRNGHILASNSAATKIFGLQINQLLGHTLESTIVPRSLRNDYERLIRFFKLQNSSSDWTSERLRVEGERQNKVPFPAELVIRKVVISEVESVLILFVRDISEDVASEQRLETALENARKHSTAQGRFLATMSHELRTPLHGVLAAIDLLTLQDLPEEAHGLVEKAGVSGRHALQQIDFALNAIRGDALTEEPVLFDPLVLVRNVVDEARLVSAEAKTRFDYDFVGKIPAQRCLGRPRAYHRALVNLVGNAAKFARGGKVTIRLTCLNGDSEDEIKLTTEVIDDGPGIPSNRLSQLFEPYRKWYSDSDIKDGQAGFGLGLWIAKEAVSMIGGTLIVQSEVGQGSHFSFTHALRLAEEKQAQVPAQNPSIGRSFGKFQGRALVVDDSRINTELMGRMVKELGYDVLCAYSGEEAVALAMMTEFDLILIDFFMPGMNGSEAVKYIRRDGASMNATILGITARIDLNSLNSRHAFGMVDVLHKPFGLSELRSTLDKIAAHNTLEIKDLTLRHKKSVVTEINTRNVRDLGAPLVQDTLNQALIAVDQAENGDPLASETAHRAGGSALMLGLDSLGDELLKIERLLETDETGAALVKSVARIRQDILDAEAEMRKPNCANTGICRISCPPVA